MSKFLLDTLQKYDPRYLADIYLDQVDINKINLNLLYDRYFSDHVIETNQSDSLDAHGVHLRRNDQLFYYVEKSNDYSQNLKDFFPNFHSSLLPYYFAWGEKSLLCLNDSWSCLGWVSHYLSSFDSSHNQEITLIHFDSHSDMANPLIGQQVGTGEYYDFLRGTKIDLQSLFDFFIAVAIGSIGISSYISILPLFYKSVDVFYINQFKKTTNSYRYSLDFIKDEFFASKYPDLLRMSNNYDVHNSNNNIRYPHCCVEANIIEECASLIDNDKSIYLHFDMDYFNNYLDGSALEFRSDKNYRTLEEQYKKIDQIMISLQKLKDNIAHTSIGLSPGFFPSQYWEPTTKYLISSLNAHGIHFATEHSFPQAEH